MRKTSSIYLGVALTMQLCSVGAMETLPAEVLQNISGCLDHLHDQAGFRQVCSTSNIRLRPITEEKWNDEVIINALMQGKYKQLFQQITCISADAKTYVDGLAKISDLVRDTVKTVISEYHSDAMGGSNIPPDEVKVMEILHQIPLMTSNYFYISRVSIEIAGIHMGILELDALSNDVKVDPAILESYQGIRDLLRNYLSFLQLVKQRLFAKNAQCILF